jgi:hypothetical protein
MVVLDSGFGQHPGENDWIYRERKELAEIALAALHAQQGTRMDLKNAPAEDKSPCTASLIAKRYANRADIESDGDLPELLDLTICVTASIAAEIIDEADSSNARTQKILFDYISNEICEITQKILEGGEQEK